jgi:phosphatidylserine decarboxylase
LSRDAGTGASGPVELPPSPPPSGADASMAWREVVAKTLHEWLETDVAPVRDRSMRWLAEQYFLRDPARPTYADAGYFFPPADGVVLYAKTVAPDAPIVEIKGRPYSLREGLQDMHFTQDCLVVGIFMTFYDVHVNRMPYAGRLCYRELDPINTYNDPMIDVEHALLGEIAPFTARAGYLFNNQRVVNRVFSIELSQHYYVLQVADYDVDSIMPFRLKQNQAFAQNQRFSQIRYGSQVDLIIPCSPRWHFTPLLGTGMHVEAGVDPLVAITEAGTAGTPTEAQS